MRASGDDVPTPSGASGAEARASGNLLALTQISRLINAHLDPQELCETVVRLLQHTFAYDRVSIYTIEATSLLHGPEKRALSEVERAPGAIPWFASPRAYCVPAAESASPPDGANLAQWRLVRRTRSGNSHAPASLSLRRGVVGRTARTGQPTLLTDVRGDPDYIERLPGVLSEIVVPLARQQEVLGVLNVESAQRRLDAQDFALLRAVADLMVVALHNARLYQQTQRERDAARRYADQLVTLHRIGHELLTAPRLSDILERITSAALEMSGGVYASLHLPTPDGQELLLVAPRTMDEPDWEDIRRFRSQTGRGIVGLCFAHSERIVVNNAEHDPRMLHRPEIAHLRLQALLALPLIAENQTIGVLSIGHTMPHVFTPELQQVLAILADQAAIAIHRTRLHEDLSAALARATELDQLKDLFLLMASHELRTPLTAVLGFLELLSEETSHPSAEEAQHFLSQARLAAEEIVLLLNNILDGTRGEVDRSKLSFQQVALAPLVAHVLTLIRARCRQRLVSRVQEGLSVWADEIKVQQVLLNLLANAVKYSSHETTVTVEASSDEASGTATISVHDQGQGIALADQPRLFQKFARLTDGINNTTPGTGLGLYISRLLVEGMGGQIGLISQPGQGSAFWFSLPMRPTRNGE